MMISTDSYLRAMRASTQLLQTQLAQVQQEVGSGRMADPGLTLGVGSAVSVSLRNQQAELSTLVDTNKIASARLDATQVALTSLQSVGQSLQQQILQSSTTSALTSDAASAGKDALDQLISLANTNVGGQYIFGGEATGAAPIAAYVSTPTSAAKAAVDAAFSSAFGTTQGSAAAGSISGPAMQSFLDTTFASLFDPSNWKATWSGASDQPITSEIAPGETAATSMSANADGFRQLAEAATMLSDLGIGSLGADARNAVLTKASALIGSAVASIASDQSSLGLVQNRISSASTLMSTQSGLLQTQIDDRESVDPALASAQITTLSTNLQASYQLTARLNQLSLVKFI